MSIKAYRGKSAAELQKELLEMRKEQFGLRIQKQLGSKPKSHVVRALRKNIARIKTLLNNEMI